MKIEDILKITQGELIIGDKNTECENFSTDTRKIEKGDTYVGLKGENFDGNLFYEKALEAGASTVIVSGVEELNFSLKANKPNQENKENKAKKSNEENKANEKSESNRSNDGNKANKENIEKIEELKNKFPKANIIRVKDSLIAYGKIAAFKRSLYNIPVVQITGSVGKTSTRNIIGKVMKTTYNTLETKGNFNNAIGLPQTILELKDENAMIVETGMNHLGEIRYLGQIVKPNIAVITNVGTAHIGNLGSRENILRAKLEILENLSKEGTLIINNDNDMLHGWYLGKIEIEGKEPKDYNIITIGIENESDIMAKNIKIEAEKSRFEVCLTGKFNKKIKEVEKYQIEVPVSGKHFIYNSLMAVAVGTLLKITPKNIQKGIANFELTKKRMELDRLKNNIILINDSYNASYDSMKAALEYLGELKKESQDKDKRTIAVLGDMFELGDFAEKLHKDVGREVAKNKIDLLVTVGNLAKNIAEEVQKRGMNSNNIKEFDKNEEAIKFLKQEKKPGDIILLKASHGMNFSQIAEALKNAD